MHEVRLRNTKYHRKNTGKVRLRLGILLCYDRDPRRFCSKCGAELGELRKDTMPQVLSGNTTSGGSERTALSPERRNWEEGRDRTQKDGRCEMCDRKPRGRLRYHNWNEVIVKANGGSRASGYA